ncbi:MAG: pyridoxine 5'-phosphate synthase [Verrucomicrobiae bacterium]|nr:pyridoxine 5'-phosphate synthase [Verrucomicrobiae bacterium]
MASKLKLGVNIDHVATLRQARYALMPQSTQIEPNLLLAAQAAEEAGADSITVHLREDRRHIVDSDVFLVREHIRTKLNLEMGNTPEILAIALQASPDFVCLVPEHRAEITTEGGLDVTGNMDALADTIEQLQSASILVSMFVDPDLKQIAASAELGADMVELHTGAFAGAEGADRTAELDRLVAAGAAAHEAGLQVNAGHGITTANVSELFAIPHLVELNIGHHIVSRAIFIGLEQAVKEMIAAMDGYAG